MKMFKCGPPQSSDTENTDSYEITEMKLVQYLDCNHLGATVKNLRTVCASN